LVVGIGLFQLQILAPFHLEAVEPEALEQQRDDGEVDVGGEIGGGTRLVEAGDAVLLESTLGVERQAARDGQVHERAAEGREVVAHVSKDGFAWLKVQPMEREIGGPEMEGGARAHERGVRIPEVALGDAAEVGGVGDAREGPQSGDVALPDHVAAAQRLVEAELVHLAQGERDAAAELQVGVAAKDGDLLEFVLEAEALEPELADIAGGLPGGEDGGVGRGGEVDAVDLQMAEGVADVAVEVELVQADAVVVVRLDAVFVVPAILEEGGIGHPQALRGGEKGREEDEEGGGGPPRSHGASLVASAFGSAAGSAAGRSSASTCSSSCFSVPLVKPVCWKARRPCRSTAWRKGREWRGLKRPRTLLSPSRGMGMRSVGSATKRRTSATVLGSSMLIARTTRPSFSYLSRRRCKMGSSCLQGAHQVAQKLSSTTFPS